MEKTLDSEIDRVVEGLDGQLKRRLLARARELDYVDRTEYDEAYEIVHRILKSETIFQLLKSIAQKTIEAVRVEEREPNLDKEQSRYCGCDGECLGDCSQSYNQAVTEQSKLAAQWLGKE